MKKAKTIGIGIVAVFCVVCIVCLCVTYLGNGNWPKRFGTELNHFFGPENWELLSSESKESLMYTTTTRDTTGISQEVPGTYKNWQILYTDPSGKETVYQITNHTLKINHDKHWLLSSSRYSSRQALILELMDIAFSIAADKVHDDLLLTVLTEQEASCLDVSISYHGGNPEPEFYDQLWREPWFTADNVNAEKFLSCDLYDFYLQINVFDYRFKNLTTEEQQNVLDHFDSIQELLLNQYGAHASFELYFGDGYQTEYVDGIKQ